MSAQESSVNQLAGGIDRAHMATAEVIKWTRRLLLVNFASHVALAATGAWLIGGAIDAGYSICTYKYLISSSPA